MRPPPLTLARIPVGRHTVVGSDMIPVLARDTMTSRGGVMQCGPFYCWQLHSIWHAPIRKKRKGVVACDFSLSALNLFPTVLHCIQVNFSAPVQLRNSSLNHASLPFPCSNSLPPYTPPLRLKLDHKNIPLLLAWCMPGIASIGNKKT